MKDVLFYQNYTPVADVSTIAIGLVYLFLLRSTYTMKQKNLTMFKAGNFLVMLAAASNIAFHEVLQIRTAENVLWIYILRNVVYISLMLLGAGFCVYIQNLIDLKGASRKLCKCATWMGVVLFASFELLTPVTRLGFYIDENLRIHQNYYTDIYRYSYMYFQIFILILLVVRRKNFIAKMFQCICSVLVVSFAIMVLQAKYLSTSYICITYTIPIMTVLFLFHHNSYDTATGTLDARAFDAYVKDIGGKAFTVVYLSLYHMNMDKKIEVSQKFFCFSDKNFKDSCTFRFGTNQFVMVYRDVRNRDAEQKMEALLEEFQKLYDKYQIDYKIVLVHSQSNLAGGEYFSLCEFVTEKMPLNTVYRVAEQDVGDFFQANYILGELQDIHRKCDLEDGRVKVYCQPVLNTVTGTFSSAEALMRLELPECGMVFPDQFIPMAEKYEYIHVLSMIILNKTCKCIKDLEQKGYRMERVSVNFSMIELRDKNFCSDITRIIRDNGVPYEKIAIELTESRNEQDFENVKQIMSRLQELGVKFYLDDFGTGYSNFERIIGLPIDIVKFDRSLTILAGKDEESRFMVGSFSDIFKRSNYQILFEGVEDEKDERQCREMNAQYLQGYKYSKPIPMERLVEFAEKAV